MDRIKVFLVDDHLLFRKGLKMLLDDSDNIEVVGEASNGKEFLSIVDCCKPEIVLMDINMPEMNGFEATQRALTKMPNLSIIALSMHGEEEYYDQMVQAGVKGFLLKNEDIDEVLKAIKTVSKGGTYFSQQLLIGILSGKNKKVESPNDLGITDRELEVLKLICEGYSNADIADKLFISQRTADRHRSNLLEKTGSRNSVALVMFAVKHKIVNPT
jgi:DNA-binding NarL/FixJ family response regulator